MADTQPCPLKQRSLEDLEQHYSFTHRHTGPDSADQKAMLDTLGHDSLDDLVNQTVPESIRLKEPASVSEFPWALAAPMLLSLPPAASSNDLSLVVLLVSL